MYMYVQSLAPVWSLELSPDFTSMSLVRVPYIKRPLDVLVYTIFIRLRDALCAWEMQ
jgi:hypothetical protein